MWYVVFFINLIEILFGIFCLFMVVFKVIFLKVMVFCGKYEVWSLREVSLVKMYWNFSDDIDCLLIMCVLFSIMWYDEMLGEGEGIKLSVIFLELLVRMIFLFVVVGFCLLLGFLMFIC